MAQLWGRDVSTKENKTNLVYNFNASISFVPEIL